MGKGVKLGKIETGYTCTNSFRGCDTIGTCHQICNQWDDGCKYAKYHKKWDGAHTHKERLLKIKYGMMKG